MSISAQIKDRGRLYTFDLYDDVVIVGYEDDEIAIPIRLLRLGLDMLDGEDRKKDELIRKLMEDLLVK